MRCRKKRETNSGPGIRAVRTGQRDKAIESFHWKEIPFLIPTIQDPAVVDKSFLDQLLVHSQ
mgnify:CR=1 FL=1